jgi:hypothetical protein
MTLLGLDLNATRARAVSGPVGDFPCPLPLDPPGVELPLVISLEKSIPEVGQCGVRLLRQLPLLACHSFLAQVGDISAGERRWLTQPRQLDADQALTVVFRRLQPICRVSAGVVVALPGYLERVRANLVLGLAKQAALPVLGSLPVPLAAALAAYAEQSWYGAALVLDIDDHALTLSAVNAGAGEGRLLETLSLPQLGLRIWKERLLNALADACVLQCRRDPRASPLAEQALFEQLDGLLDACRQGRVVQLSLQAASWYQNLLVSPAQPAAVCAGLVRQVVQEVEARLATAWPDGPPSVVLLTAAVGRLPGLVHALRSFLEDWKPPLLTGYPSAGEGTRDEGRGKYPTIPGPSSLAPSPSSDDFGDGLFQDGPGGSITVIVLSADAPARGAHAVAAAFERGDLSPEHLDRVAPLPLPQPVDAGPARLHFQGEDYLVNEARFTLGRQPGCNLVFDGSAYRGVSPQHCDIVFDHRTFMLIDRSREGTLINDCLVTGSAALRPGDWLRLGPDGPLLRFLGQPQDSTLLSTTA